MSAPNVRVAIVSFRCVESLLTLLAEIRRQAPNWQIYVWDNRSEASTRLEDLLESSRLIDWIFFCPENLGFGRALNRIAEAPGEWDVLLTVNPDAEIIASLQPLVTACTFEGVAAAGGCCSTAGQRDCTNAYRENGPVGLALRTIIGRRLEKPVRGRNHGGGRQLDGWVEGSLLALSRAAWIDVGPLDERYFLYSEEQDWQRRARLKGWLIIQVPEALFAHESMGSVLSMPDLELRSTAEHERSRRLYIKKWWGRSGLLAYRSIKSIGNRVKRIYRGMIRARW